MSDKVVKILNKRTDFLTLLNQDISKNEKICEETNKELTDLKQTNENLKELGKYPEHTALIPLCKKLYVPGRIVHTGEYLVTYNAYPHSFGVLKTLNQTLSSLNTKIETQQNLLEKFENAKYQLTERKKVLFGDGGEIENNNSDNLPKEIKSDKGVALKVGEFYEILEYEE